MYVWNLHPHGEFASADRDTDNSYLTASVDDITVNKDTGADDPNPNTRSACQALSVRMLLDIPRQGSCISHFSSYAWMYSEGHTVDQLIFCHGLHSLMLNSCALCHRQHCIPICERQLFDIWSVLDTQCSLVIM